MSENANNRILPHSQVPGESFNEVLNDDIGGTDGRFSGAGVPGDVRQVAFNFDALATQNDNALLGANAE